MAIKSQKFLPQGKVGGSLSVRPKANLVPIKKQSSSLANIGGKKEEPMLVIKTKVIKIEDILKGTLAAEKRAADEKRKAQEQEDRSKQENEVEAPKTKGKGIKIPVPGKIKSFWGNIQKYVGTVLFGWLGLQLLPLLPKLMPIVKFLATTADFIINIGGKILNGLVTFIDWGYKAVEATEKWIGDKFGEGAAEKFNSFTGLLTKTMNLVIALGIAAAAMSGRGPRVPRGGPRRGIRNRLRRTRTRIRRFTNPNADAIKRAKRLKELAKKRKAAENALKRQRLFRRIRPTNIKRVVQSTSGRIMQGARNLQQTGSNILQKVRPSNLKQAGSNLFQRVRGSKFVQGAIQKGKGALTWADDFAKSQMKNINKVITGIKAQGAKWAEQIGKNIKNMNPMKLGEKVKKLLQGPIDDILKKNKIISQIKNLNVKNATKSIGGLMKTAKNSGGLKTLMKGLEKAKAAKIGGVDKVIAAIMGLINYAFLGESPINAILQAIGGLLGYTAGFAIGAPFGGFPGFITGMAGAFVGENAAKLLIKGLAQTPLANTPDPIAEGLGLSPRMLVRDPFGQSKEEESTEKAKTEKEEKKKITTIKRNKENYFSMLSSGKRSKIEQALYELRIKAGSGRDGYDYVDNPKYKKDVDLIMEHGLDKVEIDGGKVKLQNNILARDNNVKDGINDISQYASYEESGSENEVILAPSSASIEMNNNNSNVVKEKIVNVSMDTSDPYEVLYKG